MVTSNLYFDRYLSWTLFNLEPYPHAPRLLLHIIPNPSILGTNVHNQVKEFIVILDVIEPYYHQALNPHE